MRREFLLHMLSVANHRVFRARIDQHLLVRRSAPACPSFSCFLLVSKLLFQTLSSVDSWSFEWMRAGWLKRALAGWRGYETESKNKKNAMRKTVLLLRSTDWRSCSRQQLYLLARAITSRQRQHTPVCQFTTMSTSASASVVSTFTIWGKDLYDIVTVTY